MLEAITATSDGPAAMNPKIEANEMGANGLPENLKSLHRQEEELRGKALTLIAQDARLSLHIAVVEQVMDLADLLRQFDTQDEDLKVIQVLGIRMFNAFGASLKLALSGYAQNSALVMRDILETVFLIDLFKGDRSLIERWRVADEKARKDFLPVRVREALDARDGFTSKKRADTYKLFSELAAHPNMKSVYMLRPEKDGDAVGGPYMEKGTLEAVLSEMGKLAIQAGEVLNGFFPNDWPKARGARVAFARSKKQWIAEFYPRAAASKVVTKTTC